MQVLPARPASPDWPPFVLNASTHTARESFLPEYMQPPATIAATMPLLVNVSNSMSEELSGQHVRMNITPFIVMLAMMGTICAAIVCMLRVATLQHCTLWLSRTSRHRLMVNSTNRKLKTSSGQHVRTGTTELTSRPCRPRTRMGMYIRRRHMHAFTSILSAFPVALMQVENGHHS